jgi:molybdate transport system regulatory protein
MNQLKGRIRSITTSGEICLVEVDVKDEIFSAVILDDKENLKIGKAVSLLFKETEVALAKGFVGKISLRNQFEGIIDEIQSGKILSSVRINYNGSNISSVITSNAARDLELKVGEKVVGFVKTNELMISTE